MSEVKSEVIICDWCSGYGYTTSHEITNHHKGEYDVIQHDCVGCKKHGRVLRVTHTTIQCFST